MEFKFDSSTRTVLPRSIFTATSQRTRMSPASASRLRGAPLEIGVRLGSEKFELGHVRGDTLDALAAIVLERGPLALRVDGVQFEFDTGHGLGSRAEEFLEAGQIILL